MATYTQIQTRAQNKALSQNATDAALYANEVYRDVVARCRLNRTVASKNLTAGQWRYSLTSDFSLTPLSIEHVTYTAPGATTSYPLEPTNDQEIIRLNQTVGTGSSRAYAMVGLDTFYLYPVPQGADSITLYYQAAPTAMSAGSDTPSLIPSEWQHIVTYGTAWKLAQDEDAGLEMQLKQMYEAEMAQFRGEIDKRQQTAPKQIKVGYVNRPIRRDRRDRDLR